MPTLLFMGIMEIELKYNEQKHTQITVGSIIRCEAFAYGITYSESCKGISVGWTERDYNAHLREGLRREIAIDSYELLRGEALFLVLSMELVEVITPEDVEEDERYIGVNVKCIRLTLNNKLSRDSERIFFTLHHPMSCLDASEKNIEIIGHLNLPTYWKEKADYDNDDVEKPF